MSDYLKLIFFVCTEKNFVTLFLVPVNNRKRLTYPQQEG
tara:strand:- start:201 stop:317 length:117 start_codon:yes stop_codon:yes gene_type:complete